MKYVVILVIVILFVRVDYILGLFDKANERFESRPATVPTEGIDNDRLIISVKEDARLKQTPRKTFLSLLENFRVSPEAVVREKAITILKDHPTMFTSKLDVELEAQIFRLRDHLNNNEPETVTFLVDLMGILEGENQLLLKRFFSLWIEINLDNFLAAYARTKDTNCLVASMFGDNIPQEEKLNELYEREEKFNEFIKREKVDPKLTLLANNCLLVIGLEISKLAPPTPDGVIAPGAEP